MNLILFDDKEIRRALLPFTDTRPVAGIRVGVLTIAEKWSRYLKSEVSFLTQEYLQNKFPLNESDDNVLINGAVIPNEALIQEIEKLAPGEALIKDRILAVRYANALGREVLVNRTLVNVNPVPYKGPADMIEELYDIFLKAGGEIQKDISLFKKRALSHEIKDKYTALYGEENIYVEEGVEIRAAILNATKGPIYLGKNSEVMEGACIHGPFALGEGSRVNMNAQIWGDTSIGPYCKVGGEVHNSVFFGYSNKAHSGFLGNSVIGEWCNLGADTNTSNLKNNYRRVRLWNYKHEELTETELQFCGLMMGDHGKSSINTMFNTGTVMGTCANVFGEGFPNKFIPSFTWGDSRTTFQLDKAFEIAERVLARKKKVFSEEDKRIFEHIHRESEKYRRHR